MEEIDNKIGLRLHRLDMEVKKALDAGMKNAGYDDVTLMHGWVLKYLYDNRDHDIYQRDIERAFSIGRSTVTTIIQLMEKRDLVRRESVETDARLKKVILTEKGYQHHDHAVATFRDVHARMLNGITEEEKALLISLLGRIFDNLSECKDCKNNLQGLQISECEGGLKC